MTNVEVGDALRLTGVSVAYGRGPRVLSDVSCTFPTGRICGLLGPNGSGKSTLLHAVMGLVPLSAGSVMLGADPMADRTRNDVGFCGDDLPMPELLTGIEYVEMSQALRGRRPGRSRIREAFDALSMGDACARLIHTYSHGMKRKAQLIAHVLHRPNALILDEPFRGLDPETTAILRQLLNQYSSSGRVVLVSTHDLAVAQHMCGEVTVLAGGRVRMSTSVGALLDAAPGTTLEEHFLEVTGLHQAVDHSARTFLDVVEAA